MIVCKIKAVLQATKNAFIPNRDESMLPRYHPASV